MKFLKKLLGRKLYYAAALLSAGCVIVMLFSGCATHGGWPCWAWKANTDQKNERYAEQQLDIACTNLLNAANALKSHPWPTNLPPSK